MKNKVIHTRLSDDLFDEIVKKAKTHRTTVSNLVRNLVEDFFDVSEDVSDLMIDKIRKNVLSDKKEDQITAYQPLIIMEDTPCAICDKAISAKSSAYLIFYKNNSQGIATCEQCFNKIQSQKK